MTLFRVSLFSALLCGAAIISSPGQETTDDKDVVMLDPFPVYGRAGPLVGVALTASQGLVGQAELAARPFLRRGELLEVIPGLVVTQHSGGGKANQYFLRGFNLDHGTDFAVSADGVPVNMRTHAHGQGYADVNFIIPELVEGIAFNKGPFLAGVGDFSAAGASDVRFVTELPRDFLTVSVGQDAFFRAAGGLSAPAGDGTLTLAAEYSSYDGPWVLPEDFERTNAFLRYHAHTEQRTLTFTVLAYDADWNSTDQIPVRLIADSTLSRFGAVNPTDGGASSRYGATFQGTWRDGDNETRALLYATKYRLNLFSDFTYFLDDPVRGDQFQQFDDRWVLGGSLERDWHHGGDKDATTTIGLQWRSDLINEVALRRAEARVPFATIRSDAVDEHSIGAFLQHEANLSERVRLVVGLRGDFYAFDVDSDLAANSGTAHDFIASPKLSAIFAAAKDTELYASAGTGFHSNDARGTTITIDPASGESTDAVDPLVRSKGVEVGVRTAAIKGLVSSIAVFGLEVDSELLFVGDAGSTEASGKTRRVGVEFANFYQPRPWLAFDLDVALSHGRFTDAADEDRIPGAIDRAVSLGVVLGGGNGWFGSLRGRYFGPRVLVEDDSIRGKASFLCNGRIGYRTANWELSVDVLNIFNRADNDIEYVYESRLPGEPVEGVTDVHLHPAEPRTVRVAGIWRF